MEYKHSSLVVQILALESDCPRFGFGPATYDFGLLTYRL